MQRYQPFGSKRLGYFTEVLVDGLSGAAADSKGRVTLSGLMDYLQTKVPELVNKDLHFEQKPFYDIAGYKPNDLVLSHLAVPTLRVPSGVQIREDLFRRWPDPQSQVLFPGSAHLDGYICCAVKKDGNSYFLAVTKSTKTIQLPFRTVEIENSVEVNGVRFALVHVLPPLAISPAPISGMSDSPKINDHVVVFHQGSFNEGSIVNTEPLSNPLSVIKVLGIEGGNSLAGAPVVGYSDNRLVGVQIAKGYDEVGGVFGIVMPIASVLKELHAELVVSESK